MQVATTTFSPSFARPSLGSRPQVAAAPAIEDQVQLSNMRLAKSPGTKMALQFAGIGVMFGGILASTNLPPGWVGVGIIGSMCAGLGLMALARD